MYGNSLESQLKDLTKGVDTSSISAVALLGMMTEDLPNFNVEISVFAGGSGVPLVELLVNSKLCSSKSEARKKIEEGGIYVNNNRETNIQRVIGSRDLQFNTLILLRKGKKNYVVVVAK